MYTIIGQSDYIDSNYAARIYRVEDVTPIEGTRHLISARISNKPVIMHSNIQVGDFVVYFPPGTQICHKFLSANNLYSNVSLNKGSDLLKKMIDRSQELANKSDRTEKENAELEELDNTLFKHVGSIDSNGYVGILKYKDTYSYGFAISVEALENTWPLCRNMLWNYETGKYFDMVDGEILCQEYKYCTAEPDDDHDKDFSHRLISGQFSFGYKDKPLADCMDQFSPFTQVTLTRKVVGMPVIISKTLVKRRLSIGDKCRRLLGLPVRTMEYGLICATNNTIDNIYSCDRTGVDHPASMSELVGLTLERYIPEGMTVYAMLVGYIEGTDVLFQPGYDYKCKKGQWKIVPYRITSTAVDGDVYEFPVTRVVSFTLQLMQNYKELMGKLMPIEIIWTGEMGKLNKIWDSIKSDINYEYERRKRRIEWQNENPTEQYPDNINSYSNFTLWNWRNHLLDSLLEYQPMYTAGTEFETEEEYRKYEPLCRNHKVPNQGLVVRINDDKTVEAWEIKPLSYYELTNQVVEISDK